MMQIELRVKAALNAVPLYTCLIICKFMKVKSIRSERCWRRTKLEIKIISSFLSSIHHNNSNYRRLASDTLALIIYPYPLKPIKIPANKT